jgi:hypothetical protein
MLQLKFYHILYTVQVSQVSTFNSISSLLHLLVTFQLG